MKNEDRRWKMEDRIPKGFRPKAQGCKERATLGVQLWRGFIPERVAALPAPLEKKRGSAATLSGLCHSLESLPRVGRSSAFAGLRRDELQPWAGRRNPFGIGIHPPFSFSDVPFPIFDLLFLVL